MSKIPHGTPLLKIIREFTPEKINQSLADLHPAFLAALAREAMREQGAMAEPLKGKI